MSVPLWVGRSIPCQRGRLLCPSLQHRGYLPISLPPFCLALPTVTQFSDRSHSSLGSLSASINRYRHCSLCLTYMFLPKFAAKSFYLWSSPIHLSRHLQVLAASFPDHFPPDHVAELRRHCHRSNPSSTPPHNLGENGWGRKLLILANALRGECPSLTQFPYQPSVIGIVLDSTCRVLSHCYNVHPRLSAHHLRLCQYQSSVPTLQDNLAKILLHRARGCDPYNLHINTQLNPISNLGKSLHL